MTRLSGLSAMTMVMVLATYALNANAALFDQAEIELRHDDNLTKAKMTRDVKDDIAITASASSSKAYQLTEQGRLNWTAKLAGAVYRRYQGLNNLDAGLDLTYRYKFGLGATVPELHASASATRLEYQDSARTGWLYASEVGFAQRLTARAGVQLTYQIEQRRADNAGTRVRPTIPANVFDLNSHNVILGGDYALTPEYVLAAAYGYRSGDIVSTTLRNLPIFRVSSAIAADPVFGPGQVAYTLKALTQSVNVGLSRILNDQASVTLGYEHLYSRAAGGIDYRSNLIRLTYLHQF